MRCLNKKGVVHSCGGLLPVKRPRLTKLLTVIARGFIGMGPQRQSRAEEPPIGLPFDSNEDAYLDEIWSHILRRETKGLGSALPLFGSVLALVVGRPALSSLDERDRP